MGLSAYIPGLFVLRIMGDKAESIHSAEKDENPLAPGASEARTHTSTATIDPSDVLRNSNASPWTRTMMKLYFFCLIATFTYGIQLMMLRVGHA